MESREAKLLKRKYRQVEYSDVGPSVKFSCLADEITSNFPDKDYSARMLSTIVREAFPNSESRKQHASRNKFVFGIEAMDVGPSAALDQDIPLQQQVNQHRAEGARWSRSGGGEITTVFDLESQLQRSQQSHRLRKHSQVANIIAHPTKPDGSSIGCEASIVSWSQHHQKLSQFLHWVCHQWVAETRSRCLSTASTTWQEEWTREWRSNNAEFETPHGYNCLAKEQVCSSLGCAAFVDLHLDCESYKQVNMNYNVMYTTIHICW